MNDPDFTVTIDLDDPQTVTVPEIQLLADLLPKLVKDLMALQEQQED